MCTSRVRTINEQTGKRVLVVSETGMPQWSEVWENNPRIARRDGHDVVKLVDDPRNRVYIASKTGLRYTWQRWDIRPGELYLTPAERAYAKPYAGRVLIEPNTKVHLGNKAWIPKRWQEVVDRAGVPFLQAGRGPIWLDGVKRVTTPTFRQAAAILSVSRGYVGTDGALHHAAAAFGVPAVVLWSEFCAPEFVGYASQRNIRHAGPACGSRGLCGGCKDSMSAISVDEVLENLRAIL